MGASSVLEAESLAEWQRTRPPSFLAQEREKGEAFLSRLARRLFGITEGYSVGESYVRRDLPSFQHTLYGQTVALLLAETVGTY